MGRPRMIEAGNELLQTMGLQQQENAGQEEEMNIEDKLGEMPTIDEIKMSTFTTHS